MLPPTLVRFVMIAVALLHAAAGGRPHHCHCHDKEHASLTHHSRTGPVHAAPPVSEMPMHNRCNAAADLARGHAFEAVGQDCGGHDEHDGHLAYVGHDGHLAHLGHLGHGQCDSPRCHCLTGVLGQTVRPQQPLAVAALDEVAVAELPWLFVTDRRGRGSGLQGAYLAAGLRLHQVCQRFLN
jgi:hypothetical protein